MKKKSTKPDNAKTITIHGKVWFVLDKLKERSSNDEGVSLSYNSVIKKLLKKTEEWDRYTQITKPYKNPKR